MFAKLLKYEWRASSRILTILSLAALGAGAVAALMIRALIDNALMLSQETDTGWMPAIMGLMLVFSLLGLVAYALGAEFLLLYRFYKSKFTDEGYLTFTLPVSSRQIFLASFTNIAIWSVIIVVVISVSFSMIGLIAAAAEGVSFSEIVADFPMEDYDGGYIVLSMVSSVVNFVSGIVLSMTCVVMGAVLARKHKLLAAFGVYYGVSMAMSILSTMLMFVYNVSARVVDPEAAMYAMNWVQLGLRAVLAVGGYYLSVWLMEKKLNLP